MWPLGIRKKDSFSLCVPRRNKTANKIEDKRYERPSPPRKHTYYDKNGGVGTNYLKKFRSFPPANERVNAIYAGDPQYPI